MPIYGSQLLRPITRQLKNMRSRPDSAPDSDILPEDALTPNPGDAGASESEPSSQQDQPGLSEVTDVSSPGGLPHIPTEGTMTESEQEEGASGEDSVPDESADEKTDLKELFARKSVENSSVKSLLKRHQAVDTRALTNELKEFAREIGAAQKVTTSKY